jgi:hypothetical protein
VIDRFRGIRQAAGNVDTLIEPRRTLLAFAKGDVPHVEMQNESTRLLKIIVENLTADERCASIMSALNPDMENTRALIRALLKPVESKHIEQLDGFEDKTVTLLSYAARIRHLLEHGPQDYMEERFGMSQCKDLRQYRNRAIEAATKFQTLLGKSRFRSFVQKYLRVIAKQEDVQVLKEHFQKNAETQASINALLTKPSVEVYARHMSPADPLLDLQKLRAMGGEYDGIVEECLTPLYQGEAVQESLKQELSAYTQMHSVAFAGKTRERERLEDDALWKDMP